jgi:hypothetical protein
MKSCAPELNARCPQIELDGLFAFFEGEKEGTKNDRDYDNAHE